MFPSNEYGSLFRSRVVEPGVRKRREVGVIGEDLFASDVLLELDEEARFANPYSQRVKGLHLVQLIGAQIALAQWRHAEVEHVILEGLSLIHI